MAGEPSLRRQLAEARGELVRQIEILQSPVSLGGVLPALAPDNRAAIEALQTELREVEEALANLDREGS
jgi:hypothetical protein